MAGDIRYCLIHGREALFEPFVTFDNNTTLSLHEIFPNEIYAYEEYCAGPFAFCLPPPPLDEEQWSSIFESDKEIV